MIEAVTQWVKNLIFLVLFAAFIELLLPNQSMQKFLRVVIGLLVMLAVLKPVATLFENNMQPGDLPAFNAIQEERGQNIPQQQSRDRDWLAYSVYRRELARQMQATVETLPEVVAVRVDVTLSEEKRADVDQIGGIRRVIIFVKAQAVEKENKVEVRLNKKAEEVELKAVLRNRILERVSALYQIPAEKIEINGWQ